MVSNIDAQRFFQIFKGKNNTYVKNALPKTRPEKGVKAKTKIIQVEGKVDKELLSQHLSGEFGVGICPINTDGKCYIGVLDIDCYGSKARKVLNFIRDYQLPLLPFRSKSGGLHVYLILSKSVTAKSMREILLQIVYFFALDELYGKDKVEIFPKQDSLKEGSFGNCITLPYFNCEAPYTYLLDLDGNPVDFKTALDFIQKHFTTIEAIKTALENLPYNDAPPCLQKALVSECVGSEDSGRNNFLFSFAVYAKKKYGSGFETYVQDVNSKFECPLEENVVEQICNSVSNNEYIYKCKDIPCSGLCDKVICKKREFGIGRDKGHFTGVQYGQLYRYMTAEPYYVWKLRLQGQEQWKDVIFKDEAYLLDQKNFARMCVRYLNQAPMQVSNNDWYAILNSVLPNIKDVEVKKESDTSGMNMLRNAFLDYLSNKQARRDSPYQIRVGLCVRQVQNGEAKYYFTHNGFLDYLRTKKINFDYNMLRETLKTFGAKEDTLIYTNAQGDVKKFPCWSKVDDDELEETYKGNMEVTDGDKNNLSVSDAFASDKGEEEQLYTDDDLKNAEDIF